MPHYKDDGPDTAPGDQSRPLLPLNLRGLLDGPHTHAPLAADASLYVAYILGTEIGRHIVWDTDEHLTAEDACLFGHLRASVPPLRLRFPMRQAGGEYIEVAVACPVLAGCHDGWDHITDRAGLRAVLDGNQATPLCDEHGGASGQALAVQIPARVIDRLPPPIVPGPGDS